MVLNRQYFNIIVLSSHIQYLRFVLAASVGFCISCPKAKQF